MKLSEKLQPCPFCGGKAKLEHNYEHDNYLSFVRCQKCYAQSHKYMISCDYCSDQRAIEAWNKRVENKEV